MNPLIILESDSDVKLKDLMIDRVIMDNPYHNGLYWSVRRNMIEFAFTIKNQIILIGTRMCNEYRDSE